MTDGKNDTKQAQRSGSGARRPDPARLTVLAGLVAAVTGCSSNTDGDWRVCTDAQGRRLPDIECQQPQYTHGYGSHIGWVYISRSYSAPPVGGLVSSPFSTAPRGGFGSPSATGGGKVFSAPSSGISHGGFGGIGESLGLGHGGSGAGE